MKLRMSIIKRSLAFTSLKIGRATLMSPLIFGNSKWPPVGDFETDLSANNPDIDLDLYSTFAINFRTIKAILIKIWHEMYQNCQKTSFLAYFFDARRPSWNFSKIKNDGHHPRQVLQDILRFRNNPMSHLWGLTLDGRKVFLYPPSGTKCPQGIKK